MAIWRTNMGPNPRDRKGWNKSSSHRDRSHKETLKGNKIAKERWVFKKKLRLLLVKRRAIKREKEGNIMEKGSREHRGRKVVQVFICCESTSLKRKKITNTKSLFCFFCLVGFCFILWFYVRKIHPILLEEQAGKYLLRLRPWKKLPIRKSDGER